jgi:hypothetical protein
MKLTLETNPRNCLDASLQLPSGALLLLTAPLAQDCWLFRTRLDKDLSVVAVPTFGGVNLQLRSGTTCKATLPIEMTPNALSRALHGHVNGSVPRAELLQAIKLLQAAVKHHRGATT